MRRFNKRVTLSVGIATLAVVALIGIGTSLALGGDPSANERARAKAVGVAFKSGPTTPALAVNGSQVVAADIQAEVQSVKSNIEFMSSKIQEGGDGASAMSTRLDIIQKSGASNVGLAAIVLREALFLAAREKGLSISDEAVQKEVDKTRMLADRGDAPSIAGFAEAVGNPYWDKVLPDRIRKRSMVENLYTETATGAKDTKEATLRWVTLQRAVVSRASIAILDASSLQGATVEGALSYLDSYWTVVANE